MTNTNWTAGKIPSQAGRRVLITGGNSGIGFHAALELARHGAEVILPARSEAKAADAIKRIRAEVPGAILTPAILDLASLASVRNFAAFFSERFPGSSLDLLINNAGVMALPTRELTVDGFERQFATNYLGPFALTALLFAHLKPQPGTRVVTVASSAANFGRIVFDNLQAERVYKPMWGAYSQSKLADLIFALELQRRLTAAGSPILSTAAHPGYAVTNLQANLAGFVMRFLSAALAPILSQDAAHGALPTLFAAVAPQATGGGYYGPGGFQELKGPPGPATIPAAAKDITLAKRLWSETEHLTGVAWLPR
ncbi:MAG: short-chain dehydrogenase/reductase [Alphaproteobacteria bacterium]|nr:short-chain dehydrogenase/reductase [Alphaproteobacteria bacterium]